LLQPVKSCKPRGIPDDTHCIAQIVNRAQFEALRSRWSRFEKPSSGRGQEGLRRAQAQAAGHKDALSARVKNAR
jgi:hypothetical protein